MTGYHPRLLLVEDDEPLAEALQDALEDNGYGVSWAHDGGEALAMLAAAPFAMIISDVQMAPMDGYALLRALGERSDTPPVLMMTAWGTVQEAVMALQGGAVDYLVKPFSADLLLQKVAHYVQSRRPDDGEPVAESTAMVTTLDLARRVAGTAASVMLTGESGVGKEVLARYIHRHGKRAQGPFVAVNCAAIPESLLEATLFGHEKGAFTGATQASPGKFEQAQGGTLLLDEVTEMAAGLQAKLLRVLQERELERVGGRRSIRLDLRVIATSNRDLQEAVGNGRLREDLFYRLNVFPIHIPPLRERRADIPVLAQRFLRRQGPLLGISALPRLSQAAQDALLAWRWPGNVRELENCLQRAVIMANGGEITVAHLGIAAPLPESGPVPEDAAVSALEFCVGGCGHECRWTGYFTDTVTRLGRSGPGTNGRARRHCCARRLCRYPQDPGERGERPARIGQCLAAAVFHGRQVGEPQPSDGGQPEGRPVLSDHAAGAQ